MNTFQLCCVSQTVANRPGSWSSLLIAGYEASIGLNTVLPLPHFVLMRTQWDMCSITEKGVG